MLEAERRTWGVINKPTVAQCVGSGYALSKFSESFEVASACSVQQEVAMEDFKVGG